MTPRSGQRLRRPGVSPRTPSLPRPDFWLLLSPSDAGAGGSEDATRKTSSAPGSSFPRTPRCRKRTAGRSSLTLRSKSHVSPGTRPLLPPPAPASRSPDTRLPAPRTRTVSFPREGLKGPSVSLGEQAPRAPVRRTSCPNLSPELPVRAQGCSARRGHPLGGRAPTPPPRARGRGSRSCPALPEKLRPNPVLFPVGVSFYLFFGRKAGIC